jgi:hypothetical protein
MVFLLGIYAVASASYGRSTGLRFMVDIARRMVWLDFGARVGVFTAEVVSSLPTRAPGTCQQERGETPGKSLSEKQASVRSAMNDERIVDIWGARTT